MKLLIVTIALCASPGCRTLATGTVASAPTPSVRIGLRARTWEVRCGGETLGLVVLFQEHGLARDSLYVVHNPWHQDLGVIDGLGRAYRYLPHHQEPAWVGSGTIAAGAQRILGAEAGCELIELDDTASTAASGTVWPAPPDEGLPQSR